MNHRKNLWWGPPRNFDERKHERKVSWLELFYDLAYVAAVTQITHHIAAHPSWSVLSFSFLLFALVFWSWVNGSQYYDLHGSDGIRTRLFTFFQMLAITAVAITLEDVYAGHHHSFVIVMAVIQVLITYLWWSVGFWDPSHRILNRSYSVQYILALILLLVSYFTSFDTATWLWVIVLLLNITPGLTGARTITRELKKRGQVFTASVAIIERFGLFTIIVLAESILGTVAGVAEMKERHPTAWIALIAGILVAFLLWSIYFDMTSEQETKKGYRYLQWFIYLHFPLLASFGVVGACIKVLLDDMDGRQPAQVYWMFCTAMAIILLLITGITRLMQEEEEDRSYIRPVSRVLIIASLVILIIPLFGKYLNALLFLSLIAVILFIPVMIGIRYWVRYKISVNKE